MKKANFTFLKLVMPLVLACFGYCNSYAQVYCSMNCNDNVQVSLNQECEALITYDLMLEDGNNPNICSPNGPQAFGISVRDAWDNEIPTSPYVTGADIGSTLTVKVTHLATGNMCWGTISIEDKQHPYIDCITRYVECYNDPSPDGVGSPNVVDNCDSDPSMDYYDVFTDLDCDSEYSGYITRHWTVCDFSGNCSSCDEIIYIERIDLSTLQGPEDVTLECEDSTSPYDTGWPFTDDTDIPIDFNAEHCDIAVDWTDQSIQLCAAGTFKIIRTWVVMDWCTGDIYNFTQVIKVLDTQVSITCPNDFTISTDPYYCYASVDLPEATVADDCAVTTVNTFWDGGSIDGNGGFVELPKGTHIITYVVTDACGNTDACELEITVVDQSAPFAVCDQNTVVNLNFPDCEAWVHAESFDDGSYDNCCGDDMTFEVQRAGDTEWHPAVEFTVADVGTPVTVNLRVTDCFGNQSICVVSAHTENNSGCSTVEMASISGNVEDEMHAMVSDVQLNLSGTNPLTATTADDGYYGFMNLPLNQNYTVTPERNDDALNGVTTFDLVMISRHILGVAPLDTPFKIIAADANNSESVTTLDLVTLRRLILNIDTEFTNNTSWRFVDMSYIFPDANNPFLTDFPEVVSFNDLDASEVANFMAVKVGDVNNSAIANNLLVADDRNKVGSLTMVAQDRTVAEGETVTVDFKASNFNNVDGYQFTLGFNPTALQFVDVEAGELNLTEANFGLTRLEEGAITTSWNAAEAVTLKNDVVLFSVTFTALQKVSLANALSFNSQFTTAEAYANNEVKDVDLAFNTTEGTVVANNFALYQNQPNPFSNETVIAFNLPVASSATLTVFDLSGKVLKTIEGNYAKGFNQIAINRTELSGAGVLFYQLSSQNETATKKMFIIE